MNYSKKITDQIFNEQIQKWFMFKGDKTFRVNYPELNENSVVFDIGGYHGDRANDIYNRYKCTIYVFEPIKQFCKIIKEKFKDNSKIKLYEFGLSTQNKMIDFFFSDDGTSEYNSSNSSKKEKVKLVNILEFIKNEKIEKIDLLKINIEGEEYPLLEYLSNDFDKIINIQVQFHSFIENCDELRENIINKLKLTHKRTYCYEFVWENWKKI